jgi:tetratricopeptide (TPR) repeat protein
MSDDFTIYKYTVKQGDTLCGIIKRTGKERVLKAGQNTRAVARQSGLRDPNLIRPGEVIVMYLEPPTLPHVCRGCPVGDAPAIPADASTDGELAALLAELKKLLSGGGSKDAILAVMRKIIEKLSPASSANEYALAEIIALLPEDLQKAVVETLHPSPRFLDVIVLHIQSARLKENETLLRALIQENTLDRASYADAEMMLAQNLTGQGYIAEALGLDPESYFLDAEKYLNLANQWAEGRIKDSPNAPWPNQIIARSQLIRAKIHLVRAGREEDPQKKKKHLAAAESAMLAFDKNNNAHGEIIWAELSLAYQTWGDLLVAKIEIDEGNKNPLLDKAGKMYDEAIQQNPRNYDAIASRADVYNWQEDYGLALPKYEQILREAPQDAPARRKAQLGRYEALLRSENYAEIDAAEKFALETIDQETDRSFMIPRAAKFLLEIAGARIARGDKTRALPLLNIILGDSTAAGQRLAQIYGKNATTILIKKVLMMQVYLKLGQMAKAEKKEEEAKKQFAAALKLCEEIEQSTEFNNLSAREKIEIKLGQAEAHVINKEYLKAIEIYRALLENPIVRDETRSRILLSLGDIYISEWPDELEGAKKISEEEKLGKAEFYFRSAVAYFYSEENDAKKPPEGLSSGTKLLYSRALLSLGEMRRWGNDRDQKAALKHYSKALKLLDSLEGVYVREKNALACKAHFGKAKSYEVLANRVKAKKESEEAEELIGYLPEKEQHQIRRVYARTRDPIAARFRQAKGEDEYGNTWVEHQYEVEASVPVTEKTTVKATERYNTAEYATIHSTYVGVEQQVAEGVTVRVDGKLPGSEVKLESGEEVRQFSNPDVSLQLNIEKEHYSGSARGELYFNPYWNQLNAYSADSYGKINLRNGTLRLGGEVNYYTFPYGDTFPTMLEVNPTIKYETDLFGAFGWGYDIVRLNLLAQIVTKTRVGEMEPGDKDRNLIGGGLGAGLDVNLTYLILSANYRIKADPRFSQSMFTLDANLAPLAHWLVDKIRGR